MNQQQINRQGKAYIAGLGEALHILWAKMMEDLKLPLDSKFVEASLLETSKYHQFYNVAMKQYWEAQQQYAAGGYVGCRIIDRR